MSRSDAVARTEDWFLAHGLSYFVPETRAEVRAALRLRRTVPLGLLVALVAVAGGVGLAWVSGEVSAAPALLVLLGGAAALGYALTALHASPIVGWALGQTLGTVRLLLPMTTRALPMLLLAITFLFINTEVWQVASHLSVGKLWLVVALFGALAVGFLLVRLPEEVDRADDHVDDTLLVAACAGTPLQEECRVLVEDADADPASYAEVTGLERWNLILVLLVVQVVQVLLLAVAVFGFLVVFGALVMSGYVMDSWIGQDISGVTVPLVQVSVFLAAFSGLYLTVSTVTDETYRQQFFGTVVRELERAVGVRAVYLAVRARDGSSPAAGRDGAAAG